MREHVGPMKLGLVGKLVLIAPTRELELFIEAVARRLPQRLVFHAARVIRRGLLGLFGAQPLAIHFNLPTLPPGGQVFRMGVDRDAQENPSLSQIAVCFGATPRRPILSPTRNPVT